jgi:hypothetical protein
VFIGLCTIELLIDEADSLKDKRRLLKSLMERVKSLYNVSVAEIDQQDVWRRSTLAFTCVANEKKHVFRVLQSAVAFFEKQRRSQVIDYRIEII